MPVQMARGEVQSQFRSEFIEKTQVDVPVQEPRAWVIRLESDDGFIVLETRGDRVPLHGVNEVGDVRAGGLDNVEVVLTIQGGVNIESADTQEIRHIRRANGTDAEERRTRNVSSRETRSRRVE